MLEASFYRNVNQRPLTLMRCRYVSDKRPPSSRFMGSLAELMCLQTKTLMLPPVGCDNFRIIPTYCMICQASTFWQSRNFLFDICSADERLLLSLPAKKGGLAIPIFSATADSEFSRSRAATEQLIEHINNQDSTPQVDSELLKHSKRHIVKAREVHNEAIL